MHSTQYVSQQSDDMSVYFPHGIDLEEALLYQSPEVLMNLIDYGFLCSPHRTDAGLFDPVTDDMEASSALSNAELAAMDNKNSRKNDVRTYLREPSTVIPHTPSLPSKSKMNANSSPTSRSRKQSNISPSSPMNMRKLMVFDEVTGRERRPLLHEFLRLLLEREEYAHLIEYLDCKQGMFKIHKPKDVSELWKHVKGRNSDNRKLQILVENFCMLKSFFV